MDPFDSQTVQPSEGLDSADDGDFSDAADAGYGPTTLRLLAAVRTLHDRNARQQRQIDALLTLRRRRRGGGSLPLPASSAAVEDESEAEAAAAAEAEAETLRAALSAVSNVVAGVAASPSTTMATPTLVVGGSSRAGGGAGGGAPIAPPGADDDETADAPCYRKLLIALGVVTLAPLMAAACMAAARIRAEVRIRRWSGMCTV